METGISKSKHIPGSHSEILDMMEELKDFNRRCGWDLSMRMGINSGPLVARIIGEKKFIYDLWGDTVNVASRMESTGTSGQIQVTETTYDLLCDRYAFKKRGLVEVKGKGRLMTYFLLPHHKEEGER